MKVSKYALVLLLMALVAGCTPTPMPPDSQGSSLDTGSIDVNIRDAEIYAETYRVDLEEATRRLALQDEIGGLNAILLENEPETFAGLWLEHTPEFRVFARFTKNGERTLRNYTKGGSLEGLVEVVPAEISLVELQEELSTTSSALEKLSFNVVASLNVITNRVEVYVTDVDWFEKQLSQAGISLPEHTIMVLQPGTGAKKVDSCSQQPVAGIAFPRQKPVEGMRVSMAAELIGLLHVEAGCLQVDSIYGDGSVVPIWPAEYSLQETEGVVQVLDENLRVVARVGEEVYMAGGFGSQDAAAKCEPQEASLSCSGPYWVVGDTVRLNLNQDSDLFALDLITADQHTAIFIRSTPEMQAAYADDQLLAGQLVLWPPQRCPRVTSESGLRDFMPIWPPSYSMLFEEGALVVLNEAGNEVGREGEQIILSGKDIPIEWEHEEYQQLRRTLPGDCHGPYWVVGEGQ